MGDPGCVLPPVRAPVLAPNITNGLSKMLVNEQWVSEINSAYLVAKFIFLHILNYGFEKCKDYIEDKISFRSVKLH